MTAVYAWLMRYLVRWLRRRRYKITAARILELEFELGDWETETAEERFSADAISQYHEGRYDAYIASLNQYIDRETRRWSQK